MIFENFHGAENGRDVLLGTKSLSRFQLLRIYFLGTVAYTGNQQDNVFVFFSLGGGGGVWVCLALRVPLLFGWFKRGTNKGNLFSGRAKRHFSEASQFYHVDTDPC